MKKRIINKIDAEYEAIEENILEIQQRLTQISSSIDLIRYLDYLENTFDENFKK